MPSDGERRRDLRRAVRSRLGAGERGVRGRNGRRHGHRLLGRRRVGAGQGQLDRLWSALGAWRSQFLTAADVARYPPARREATSPDGTDGDTSVGQAGFDPNAGVLTVSGDARVDKASFGSGAVVLRAVHTHVSVANGGTPRASIVDDVADVEVDGVPVVLGQQGLSVNGAQVPGVANAIEAANSALNSALAQGGITVSAVAPRITNGDNQETVDAAAAQVGIRRHRRCTHVSARTRTHTHGLHKPHARARARALTERARTHARTGAALT